MLSALLFWSGVVVLSIGAMLVGIVVFVNLSRLGRDPHAALKRRPLVSLATARAGPVRLRGRVLPSEQGVIAEPLQHRPALWCRIDGYSAVGSAGHSQWRHTFTERDGRDFWFDDGSGRPARVFVADMGLLGTMDMFGGPHVAHAPDGVPWVRHELTPHIDHYVKTRGGSSGRTVKAHRWALAPGDEVTVVGTLTHDSTGPSLRSLPEDPLVLYLKSEAEIFEDLRVRSRNRKVITAVGLAMMLMGAALMTLS